MNESERLATVEGDLAKATKELEALKRGYTALCDRLKKIEDAKTPSKDVVEENKKLRGELQKIGSVQIGEAHKVGAKLFDQFRQTLEASEGRIAAKVVAAMRGTATTSLHAPGAAAAPNGSSRKTNGTGTTEAAATRSAGGHPKFPPGRHAAKATRHAPKNVRKRAKAR